jgi:hypothetical protein
VCFSQFNHRCCPLSSDSCSSEPFELISYVHV